MGFYIISVRFDGSHKEALIEIISNLRHVAMFTFVTLANLTTILIIPFLMKMSQDEILTAWNEANNVQKQFENILSQLEEAIITKSLDENKIAYSNLKGDKIISAIEA